MKPTAEHTPLDAIKAKLAKRSYMGSPPKQSESSQLYTHVYKCWTGKGSTKVKAEEVFTSIEIGSYVSFICKDGSRLYGIVRWTGKHPTKPEEELVGLQLVRQPRFHLRG